MSTKHHIYISQKFWTDSRVRQLKANFGSSGALFLIELCMWARENCKGGDLSKFDAEDIPAIAEWKGDVPALVDALASAGFINGEPGSFRLDTMGLIDFSGRKDWRGADRVV